MISIIIPTYNERENIAILIREIAKYIKNYSYEIIVVDDNSPDGTAEAALSLASTYPVRVIKRPDKLGLTSAIYDGIQASRSNIIVVMDADLQHPPDVLPKLISKLDKCDIVVASRHAPGGSIQGWSLTRRIISRGAITLTRILVPSCSKIKDPVSGFFAAKRESIIRWKPIEPKGYKALVEIIGVTKPKEICEEPYVFMAREKGVSKLNMNIILSYVKLLVKLGWKRILFISILLVLLTALLRLFLV